MSKELSPLEALENIKESLADYREYAIDCLPTKAKRIREENNDDFKIVETALKDYESMKQAKIIVVDKKISDDDLEQLKNQRMFVSSAEQCEVKLLFDEETQKKLKALEIIKEKNVNVYMLLWYFTYSSYEQYVKDFSRDDLNCDLPTLSDKLLTKEEFDLLEEVLYSDSTDEDLINNTFGVD